MKFKKWLLNEELETLDTHMPVPDELEAVVRIMNTHGKICYVVGGAVRDHLFNLFHRLNKDINDYDLATNALPEETRNILHGKTIGNLKLEIFNKGLDQGVLSIIVKDKNNKVVNEFEIATFRKEVYSGNSRKPEKTEFGASPEEDTQRRDLNYNALFYDAINKTVKDYNSGKGIKDIQNKQTSVVGDPYHRFGEDQLRVLRVVRFFNRYNSDNILDHIQPQTKEAITHYKNLENVSKERIYKEFISGLKQSQSPANFIRSLTALDLLHNALPVELVTNNPEPIDNMKGLPAILAYLLHENQPDKTLQNTLIKNKFEYDTITPIFIILKTYNMLKNPENHNLKIHEIVKDIHKVDPKSLMSFMQHFGLEKITQKLYQYTPKYSGTDVINLGLRGSDISKKLDQMEKYNFFNN